LLKLAQTGVCQVPVYRCPSLEEGKRVGMKEKKIAENGVIILEGYLGFLDERVRSLCDVKVFLEVNDWELIWKRRSSRYVSLEDYTALERVYFDEVLGSSYHKYIEPTKQYADLILNSKELTPEQEADQVVVLVQTKLSRN